MILFPLLLPGSVFQRRAAASVSVSALRERLCSSPSPSSISGLPRSPRSRSLPSAASRRLSFPHETERRAPAASAFATRCSGSGAPEWACHHEQGSPDRSLFSPGLLLLALPAAPLPSAVGACGRWHNSPRFDRPTFRSWLAMRIVPASGTIRIASQLRNVGLSNRGELCHRPHAPTAEGRGAAGSAKSRRPGENRERSGEPCS